MRIAIQEIKSKEKNGGLLKDLVQKISLVMLNKSKMDNSVLTSKELFMLQYLNENTDEDEF